MTSDGTTELFTTTWTFATARTIEDRFYFANTYGEAVSWSVVDATTGATYSYSGTWWFSDGAGITSGELCPTCSGTALSADDGVWAAGSGTINGNGASGEYGSWGVGNQNGADTACDNVYAGSTSSYTTYSTVKNYMYVSGATHGSATTPSPSRPPTPSPTAANQVTAATLFVVTTASACAEYLGFGGGASWSGDSAYLCVDCDTSAHDTWTQVR